MPLPSRIKIGGLHYEVAEVLRLIAAGSDGKDTWLNGHITFHDCRIEIEQKIAPTLRAAVLWHEALHGILEQAGQEQPESVIHALGYGIVQVMRENPDLVRFTVEDAEGAKDG